MFSKLFTRNHPVKIEQYKIEPDEMFRKWLEQMRNPTSTDTALRDRIESAQKTADQPSMREAA